ncbi:hypothetical protein, partial [Ralstonia pseudosolanacearum]
GLATQLRLAFSMFFFPHPAFTPQRRGIFKRALRIAFPDCKRSSNTQPKFHIVFRELQRETTSSLRTQ